MKTSADGGQVGGLPHEPDGSRLMADQMRPGVTCGALTACHRLGGPAGVS
jgi:hypothetical protein